MRMRAILASLAILVAGPALAADPAAIDWPNMPSQTVTLFYPGQSSYQWLRSAEHKRANRKTMQGDSCISCHEDEEQDIGELIVSGERLEPNPIAGKQAAIDQRCGLRPPLPCTFPLR